ncbi:MAG TPA: 30S ribosomal protein S18 [Terriglobia bacterium]|nr:30S ribosomal protein S18 [Terriglobia bacterium]
MGTPISGGTGTSGGSTPPTGGTGGGSGRSSDRPRRGPGGPGGRRQYFRRRKVCKFCDEKIDVIDYKDVRLVSQFVSDRGKILPRRLTGTCSPHQRLLTVAIKRARNLAFIPFASGR